MRPDSRSRSIIAIAGGAALLLAGVAAVGCSRSTMEEAPTGPKSPMTPEEKGFISTLPEAFNQNQNAADAITSLEGQGYLVQINNGGGYSASSVLADCKITGVDGFMGNNPPPSTTVYLTLSCPNSNN